MERLNDNVPHFSYLVTPRDQDVGGGWRLQLFDEGVEVGGGAFPVTDEVSEDQAYFEATGEGEEWLISKIAPASNVTATAEAGQNQAQEAYYFRHLSACAQGQGFDSIASALTELDRLRATAAAAAALPDIDQATIDKHLDAVLRASGSGLRYYSLPKSLADMRDAMRAAMGTPAATSAAALKPYTFASNYCDCHPETCACDPYKVLNPDGSRLCTAFSRQSAERVVEQLNRDTGRAAAKGALGREGGEA